MKKTIKTTNGRSRRFSLLVTSDDSSRIRRLSISKRAVLAGLASAGFVLVVTALSITSVVHYRGALKTTEKANSDAAKFAEERAALNNRIADLESDLSRVERFASKMESFVSKPDENSSKTYNGIGPVDEETWMPSAADIDTSAKTSSLGGMWRSPFASTLGDGFKLSLKELSDRIESAEDRVHAVFALQNDKLQLWASLPTVWPANGWITSEFGDVRGSKRKGSRLHEGIDIAGPRGTPIMASGSGIVTFAGYYKGYGNMLVIDHGHGITTLYGHCQSVYVAEGQQIKRGMLVAAVGNTGRSTGPHLHFEVQVDGVPVNPMLYIMQDM